MNAIEYLKDMIVSKKMLEFFLLDSKELSITIVIEILKELCTLYGLPVIDDVFIDHGLCVADRAKAFYGIIEYCDGSLRTRIAFKNNDEIHFHNILHEFHHHICWMYIYGFYDEAILEGKLKYLLKTDSSLREELAEWFSSEYYTQLIRYRALEVKLDIRRKALLRRKRVA